MNQSYTKKDNDDSIEIKKSINIGKFDGHNKIRRSITPLKYKLSYIKLSLIKKKYIIIKQRIKCAVYSKLRF